MKQYFRFSKKELAGLTLLLIIILVFAVLPLIPTRSSKEALPEKETLSLLQAFPPAANKEQGHGKPAETVYNEDHPRNNGPAVTDAPARLFIFDPNTISEADWLQLGLRKRTVRTILNYRSKGGTFRKPDDLKKIYGLRPEEFERLQPYIRIAAPDRSFAYPASPEREKRITRTVVPIDINTADTTAYKSLYGIGSRLAARIVNFREKLGGFYSIRQVGETYGVPDSTFRKIMPYLRLNESVLRKLDINTASYEALNAHPYISSKLAYLIVKQRRSGPITSIEMLQPLVTQTNDVWEKLAPYIRFE
ncbi:helix-hairpin-helix domain-containing protein [Niabella beijingensis]|uniref:helix-hairpin-helix domain-containing protein n=1 Tax=Niabella beijingensis TaxID=2872700 RepID=UPI001CBD9595|nr:helix-hairpin-helix domain-containing protein [Niabella beijingensis]MBZ4188236.1 helix-hairpin-helix domain-containing protein [Niabella beijingensis]